MKLISRDRLRKKLDRKDDFKLVFVLGDWHYMAKHIPGSLHLDTPEKAKGELDVDDDIVVYCSDANCVASQHAYHRLRDWGYKKVRRYEGGIADWEDAGYPLKGEFVD